MFVIQLDWDPKRCLCLYVRACLNWLAIVYTAHCYDTKHFHCDHAASHRHHRNGHRLIELIKFAVGHSQVRGMELPLKSNQIKLNVKKSAAAAIITNFYCCCGLTIELRLNCIYIFCAIFLCCALAHKIIGDVCAERWLMYTILCQLLRARKQQ